MQVEPHVSNRQADDVLGALMYDAIHCGHSLYSAAERAAWLPSPNAGAKWSERLAAQKVCVARQANAPIGFMTLETDYIDLAYVAACAQGQGVFRALYEWIEGAARGQKRLWTHASLMAQPAFLAAGFRVIRHQTVARQGENLRRAEMEKILR